MRNLGVGSWTARRARMSPGRVALVYEGGERTYARVHERVTRVAGALRELGVGHGDRVGYLGRNHPALLETLFAAGAIGAVFVPLNWRLTPAELAYILTDSGARVVVHAPEHDGAAAELRRRVPARWVGLEEYERFAAMPAGPLDEPVDPDEPCMIMYTSGTTGRPKGAVLSHTNIAWNCVNLLIDVDLAADEVTLVGAPMFHVGALNQTVLPTFLKGGRSVLMPVFDPARALELIEELGVTFLFGVPAMFQSMTLAPGWERADLSSVRSAICGGAPVPEPLIATYQRRGVTFLQGYGLTEAAPGVLFLREDDSVRKAGSAGTPAFFTDVRVVTGEGTDAAPGEPGEIVTQGPNVMPGYWGLPEATAETVSPDGWLRTGDVGLVDAEGFFYVRDRVKDMIISGGENIYPAEVEAALYAHPAVAECAVVGVPDERWGEVGRAVVVLRDGRATGERELLEFLAGRIASYKIPKSVVFTDALPRTASGKVRKSDLRPRIVDGRPQADRPPGSAG